MELIEVNRVAVRHDHPVEDDRQTALLTESARTDLARLTQHDGSIWDEYMLSIVRVHGARNQDLNRTNRVAVESIHENRIHSQPLIDDIWLAYRRVDIDLAPLLSGRLVERATLLLGGLPG